MKLLLDTHLVLWAAGTPKRLSPVVQKLLETPENELLVSAVSFWEIVIKQSLNRDDFKVDPRRLRRGLRDNGWTELPMTTDHALAVDRLPALHRDPFDRMLVAQAQVEGVVLLTADALVAQYPASIRQV